MTLRDKMSRLLKDSLDYATEVTSEYTRKGRIRLEILALKKEIEEKMLQLGGDVYHLVKEDGAKMVEQHNRVSHLIRQIEELEKELEDWMTKLKQVNNG